MAFVAAYNLDGTSRDSISGSLGNDQAITYSAANGKVGQGASFNGSSSRITDIRSMSTFSYIQNTGVFSINVWLKRSSIGSLVFIMGNTPTTVEKGFFWGFTAANAMRIVLINGSGTAALDYTSGSVISDTNWHMWTLVGNGMNVKIYRDASLVATSGSIGTLSSGDSTRLLTIGQITNFVANWYAGQQDIAYFYNHSLSQGEIDQLYNSGNGLQFFNSGMFQYFLQ